MIILISQTVKFLFVFQKMVIFLYGQRKSNIKHILNSESACIFVVNESQTL